MALVPNARSRRIEESATLAITAKAARMKAQGLDVVSLGAGEPDFVTPAPIAQAGIRAIEQGNTRYTPAPGTPELRAAGAKWLGTKFGLSYTADEVMVCAGAKAALHMALDAIVEPGDAVLILNYPNNPSGAVPQRAELQAIVDVCKEHGMWIVSDEIYATLLYENAQHVSPAALPGGRERTIVVNGFTKSHTLTGWRTSFLAGPRAVVDAACRIQSQVLGNPCTISQAATLAACQIDLPEEQTRRMTAFDERRRYLVAEINRIPGLRLPAPLGAFYALVDVRELAAKKGLDDVGICERLLDQHLLAAVPGSAFAIPGFVRFSYAAAMDQLRQAVARLRAFAESK